MTSHPEFGESTSSAEVARIFADHIKGKNVVITGVGPNSLGEAMALSIAAHDPGLLILASRTKEKLAAVEAKINEASPTARVKTVLLDLMSQKSIKKAADEINGLVDRVDILINNAGIMVQTRKWTEEKIEGQFGTNHVGPFLFTNLLMDKLRMAAKQNTPGSTRIVNVSSGGHRLSPIRFHDYNFEGKEIPEEEMHLTQLPPAFLKKVDGYPGFIAYGQSKAANILFSVYLTEQLKEEGIVSYSLHPGSIWTELSRNLDAEGYDIIGKTSTYWKTPDQGASTMLVAALDPALNQDPPGIYLNNCQFEEAVPHATNPKIAERLWHLSEELVGREFKLK